MIPLKSNNINELSGYTHNVYLRYDDDPFGFKCEAILICLQGFQRTRWQEAWQVGIYF